METQPIQSWSFEWQQNIGCFAIRLLVLASTVRIILSLVKAVEVERFSLSVIWKRFGSSLGGFSSSSDLRDYWHPFVLGVIEIFAYSTLMRVGFWSPIGAWIGLKTLVHWNKWSEQRRYYTRFLIGNALVLIASALLARSGG